ncbi:MAG: DUF3857 domain-containing protein [Bacteroidota bacterium]|nr:DUF3857 domain-containing protein [Bacteroidota bacterium]
MKKLTYLLPGILFLLFPLMIFSQDENYDAVYQQLTKEYTLNTDGSVVYRYVKKQKIQSYRAFHSLYGETFISYNPGYQSLNIHDAYAITSDGKKVSSPKNAFNEVLPGFAVDAPAYNNLREMVITHTGLGVGAVINLDYEIRSAKGFYPCLMGNELLSESEPVKDLTIRIKVPVNENLSYRLLNSELVPVVTTEKGFRVYTWKMSDVPAIAQEECQKDGYELYPRLIFSTAKDRLSVYQSLIEQPSFRLETNDEMKKAVNVLKADNKDPMDILLKLQEMVVNDIRLWTIPLRYTGFSIRPAVETWNSNGGTLAEKAILLSALLNEAGISAEPVLVVKKDFFDEKVGSLMDVEDFLVKAETRENGDVYLSVNNTNSQNLKYALPDRILVSLKAGAKPVVKKSEEYLGKIVCQANFTLNEKKQLDGDISVTLRNSKNPWLNLLRDKSKAKALISRGISSSDLKEAKILQPGQEESFFNYLVKKETPFHKDTQYFFFRLPVLLNGLESWTPHQLVSRRTVPFAIYDPSDEEYEFHFTLPSGLNLYSPVKNVEINNKAGEFIFKISQEGDKVVVKKKIHFRDRLIPVAEYADLKALLDHWNNDHYSEVIFSE